MLLYMLPRGRQNTRPDPIRTDQKNFGFGLDQVVNITQSCAIVSTKLDRDWIGSDPIRITDWVDTKLNLKNRTLKIKIRLQTLHTKRRRHTHKVTNHYNQTLPLTLTTTHGISTKSQ